MINTRIDELGVAELSSSIQVMRILYVDLSGSRIKKLYIELKGRSICLFSNFKELRELILDDNPIESTHPINFRQCSYLNSLSIRNSKLTKQIHLFFLRNLSALISLKLTGHLIYGLKAEIIWKLLPRKSRNSLKILEIDDISHNRSLLQTDDQAIKEIFPCLSFINTREFNEHSRIDKSPFKTGMKRRRRNMDISGKQQIVLKKKNSNLTPNLKVELSSERSWYKVSCYKSPKIKAGYQGLIQTLNFNKLEEDKENDLDFYNKRNSMISPIKEKNLFTFCQKQLEFLDLRISK